MAQKINYPLWSLGKNFEKIRNIVWCKICIEWIYLTVRIVGESNRNWHGMPTMTFSTKYLLRYQERMCILFWVPDRSYSIQKRKIWTDTRLRTRDCIGWFIPKLDYISSFSLILVFLLKWIWSTSLNKLLLICSATTWLYWFHKEQWQNTLYDIGIYGNF